MVRTALSKLLDKLDTDAAKAVSGPYHACGSDRGGCKCGQVWSGPADSPIATCNREWGDHVCPHDGKPGYFMEYGRLNDGLREANAIHLANADPEMIAALVSCTRALARVAPRSRALARMRALAKVRALPVEKHHAPPLVRPEEKITDARLT